MTDGEALLRSILANPDEDVPRLAYADWLDENNGDPLRAAFIRAQIAGAGDAEGTVYRTNPFTSRVPGGNAVTVARERLDRLVNTFPWNAGIGRAPGSGPAAAFAQVANSTMALVWRRGFIEGVFCAPTLVGIAGELLAGCPVRCVVPSSAAKITADVSALFPHAKVRYLEGWVLGDRPSLAPMPRWWDANPSPSAVASATADPQEAAPTPAPVLDPWTLAWRAAMEEGFARPQQFYPSPGRLLAPLATALWHFSRVPGNDVFSLPVARVASACGIANGAASAVIYSLVEFGVLRMVNSAFSYAEGKARTFRFTGKPASP